MRRATQTAVDLPRRFSSQTDLAIRDRGAIIRTPSSRVNVGRERCRIAQISEISRRFLHFGGLGISRSQKVFQTIFRAP
jgi:hypothetical protein